MDHPRSVQTATQRWAVRGSAALLALAAAAVAGVLLHAGGGFDGLFSSGSSWSGLAFGLASLLMIAWAAAPLAVGAWVVVLTQRTWPRALAVAAAGSAVLAAFTGLVLWDFLHSDSSTAVLIFLFLPLYLWLGLGVVVGTCAALHTALERRAGRRAQAV